MSQGFTATGQPVMGRWYRLTQGDLDVTCKVVGKLIGKGGNADLLGVILQEPSGARGDLPWPIEASEGAPPISFVPAAKPEGVS